jgi:type IV pilus assembly protein PilV
MTRARLKVPEQMNLMHPIANHSRGFTLVEALVSLVVMSVGMIGIAAMYAQGLGAERTSQYRGIAVNLAADLADRIRSNRLAAGAYAAGAADNACDPAGGGGVDCTPAEMAAHDLFLWDQQVTAQLPNGAWQVQFNAGALPPSYTMQLNWVEVGQADPVEYAVQIQVPGF